ncbi:MAG: SAM-dependent chlorinase/fluorinase [Solobacterium sp.]|nr:SAM-dependent chlorinase/fluorinase [Solobacterium sp.]
MKPLLVIQTDFSLSWSAVAQMKGVMKIVDPQLEIIDLCHDIKKFDPWEASLSLQAAEPYWPKGTIFVSVVDPGVGTPRKACAAKLNDGSIVITPDNGTLTHLLHSVGILEVREIDEALHRYRGGTDNSVFHGRDLFGYCAAKLASAQITYEEVGPAYPISEIVICEEYDLKPTVSNGRLEGFVMTGEKHFGGISLNIRNEQLEEAGLVLNDPVFVEIMHQGKTAYRGTMRYVKSFGYVAVGEPLLYKGSSGYAAIDLNQGNFIGTFGIGTGKEWTVTVTKGENNEESAGTAK